MRRLLIAAVSLAIPLSAGAASAAAEEAPVMGAFRPAGTLVEARSAHQALLLPDGRVLIVGGVDEDSAPVAGIEIWDPATETFARAGRVREDSPVSAALLPDGRVLILDATHAAARIWDPQRETLWPAGSLSGWRRDYATASLPDGSVLVLGGEGRGDTAELWDPETSSFTLAGTLKQGRADPTTTVLADGRVLITGGWNGKRISPLAEVWEPAEEVFRRAGELAVERPGNHTATLLPDGRALVVEDSDSEPEMPAIGEIWDPATNGFVPGAEPLASPSGYHTATLLEDGSVLVITDRGSAEVWDPAASTFRPVDGLARTSAGELADSALHSATPLPDGRVLVTDAGGYCAPLAAEVWDPAKQSFGPTGPMLQERTDYSATPLGDGRLLIVGGDEQGTAEIWDPTVPAPVPPPVVDAPGPSYDHGRQAAESDLLSGVRRDLRGTCQPVSGSLPEGVVAGLDCRPSDRSARRVGVRLFESQEAMLDAYRSKMADRGVEPGAGVGCQEGPYLPTPTCAAFDQLERDMCFLDDSKQAHYFFTQPPFVLVDVVGRGRDSSAVRDWAWRGNQDVPGSPTAWREGRRLDAEHRRLEALLPAPHACKAYRKSAAENDPFAYGADAAIDCGQLSSEGFPGVSEMTLFRFPDATSMDEYWTYRAEQNPPMPARPQACRSGKRGYGTWAYGEYFCYVSDGGHALLRWSDQRTNTYGGLDAVGGKLAPLYRAWTKLRP